MCSKANIPGFPHALFPEAGIFRVPFELVRMRDLSCQMAAGKALPNPHR